jgi:hypothetical protein
MKVKKEQKEIKVAEAVLIKEGNPKLNLKLKAERRNKCNKRTCVSCIP